MSLLFVLACLQAGQTQTTTVYKGPIQTLPPVGQATQPYQLPQQATAGTPGTVDFTSPVMVAEQDRIAMTPRMDGKIADEDWDPFTSTPGVKTYLDWTPGTIYAAGTGPVGSDMVLSLDLGADGWLVGANNVEVRVTSQGSTPSLTVEQLNASGVSGPVWHLLAGFVLSSYVTAYSDGTNITYTLKLSDPGYGFLPTKPRKIAARIDMVPTTQAEAAPYQPRTLAPVNLLLARSAVLPTSLKWQVERTNRPFGPEDDVSVRLNFTGVPGSAPTKVDMRAEGDVRDKFGEVSVPFPPMDGKGHAFVDYSSKITPGTESGYHVLRAVVTASDGTPGIIEASFRIARLLDVFIANPNLPLSASDRSVSYQYVTKTYTQKPIMGVVTVTIPPAFRLVNGGAVQKFTIFDPEGRLQKKFEVFIPGNTVGTFPITFQVDLKKGPSFTFTRYVNIGPM